MVPINLGVTIFEQGVTKLRINSEFPLKSWIPDLLQLRRGRCIQCQKKSDVHLCSEKLSHYNKNDKTVRM